MPRELKQDTWDQIADLVGEARQPNIVATGSTLDARIFHAAVEAVGVPYGGNSPRAARNVVERAGLDWRPNYDSTRTPSGGGGTVTHAGLKAVLAALRVLLAPAPEGFLLTWNPANWPVADEQWAAEIDATAAGQPIESRWATGNRTSGIQDGDRAFLLRQGNGVRGIIASGTFRSGVFQDGHWGDSSRQANYADVDWDTVIDPDDPLPLDALKAAIPGHNWEPQASGTLIPENVLPDLEALWAQHTAAIRPPVGTGGGQARQRDAERRKKTEDAAQARLMAYYEADGWHVEDLRIGNPFDARATKGGEVRYLEAKGTTSKGETVIVTRAEVAWARQHPGEHVIGIWSGIRFDANDEVDPSSGRFRVFEWNPDDDDLDPIAYDWSVGGVRINL